MTTSTDPLFPDGYSDVLRLSPERPHRLNKARQFVCDAIAPWGGAPPDNAALMTSEAVGNAILHAGGEVTLRVRRDGARALVEVHDHSSEQPEVLPADPHRIGGNGMRIIDALASSWGVNQIHDDGKIVWFEIPLPT